MKSRYTDVRRQCDEASLELRFYLAPKQTVFSILLRIGRNLITYENVFPDKKRELLSNFQVKYVEDVIIKRDTASLGMSRKEVIQESFQIQMGFSFPFLRAKDLRSYLLNIRARSFLLSCT